MFNQKILTSFKNHTYDNDTNAYDFYLEKKNALEKFYSVIPNEYFSLIEEEIILALESDLAKNPKDFANIMRKVVHALVEIPYLAQVLFDLSADKTLQKEKFISSLLHDIGHFKQYLTIQSFNNFKYDHCIKGAEVFKQKLLDHKISKNNITDITYIVILDHGATTVANEDPDTIKCLYFLRNIDQISSMEAWDRNQRKVIENDKNGWGLARKGYSKKVLDIFLSSKAVNYKYRKTVADAMICYLAFIYDFYYKEALQLVLNEKMLENIIRCIPPFLEEEDMGIIEVIRDHLDKHSRSILS